MALNDEENAWKTVQYQGQQLVKLVKWQVRIGTRVTRGSILYQYQENDVLKNYKGNFVGTIKELAIRQGEEINGGTTILRYESCQHAEVIKDLCADCGDDLRHLAVGNKPVAHTASVSMIHSVPELKISVERAEELGKADEERLLQQRKLVLLVDLDQTIIHTTNENVPNDLDGVFHFQLGNSPWYHTKFRPHTLEFLESISELYELHICTFGARLYAHTIANLLDPTKEKKTFSHRILSRDECLDSTSKSGNLKALFPCGDSMVCIIDDREDVWNFAPNLIAVKPYHYFKNTGDINSPFTPDDDPFTRKNVEAAAKIDKVTKVSNSNDEVVKDTILQKNAEDEPDKQEVAQIEVKEDEELAALEPKSDSSKIEDENDSLAKTEGAKLEEVAPAQDTGEKGSDSNGELVPDTDKLETPVDGVNNDKADQDLKTVEAASVKDVTNAVQSLESISSSETLKQKEEKPKSTKDYSKFVCDDHDDYLLYLEDILKRIHEEFFNDYKNKKQHLTEGEAIAIPDLKEIVPRVRRRVLQGVNIVFSGVIPTNMPKEKNQAYVVAKALGANILNDVVLNGSPFEKTTHVVAAKFGTAKVNMALRNKKHGISIVNPLWLYECSERWEHVDEQLFALGKDCTDFQGGKDSRLTEDQQKFLTQPVRSSQVLATGPVTRAKVEDMPVYDPVTGKRVQKLTKPVPGSSKNSSVENSRDADQNVEPHHMVDFSPLASFSAVDLQQMGREVDDACSEGDHLSDDSSSSDDEGSKSPGGPSKRKIPPELEQLSSEESMSSEFPKGWTERDIRPAKKMRIEEDSRDDTRDSYTDVLRDNSESESSDGASDFDTELAADLERDLMGQ
ncbi:RNA polymerase II subunit A C-terminal domain phosphatase [Halotydeus destructor]|nr:RNA polymerase II subunit A C-terminal domain phosphatase [Halotydeus destructor]